jgi:hypothetical protein
MSTSTELREGRSEQERSTVNQLTTTGLTLVSAGFTLYPTRVQNGQTVALGVAAPRVRWYPHRPMLIIPERSIAQVTGELPSGYSKGDLRHLEVAGYDISMAEQPSGKGAVADGSFEMIPKFESFSCGVRLASNWRDLGIDTWFTFESGNVIAEPTPLTFRQTCESTDCSGHTWRGQRFTDQTAYVPEVQTRSTIFLKSEERSAAIEFIAGPAYVVLTNFLRDDVPPEVGIDLAHIDSMLQLSKSEGEIRFTLGSTVTPTTPGSIDSKRTIGGQTRWPRWLREVLDLNPFVGRPHCGARQMLAPVE